MSDLTYIGDRNPRAKQPSVEDNLVDLLNAARIGSLVGHITISIDKDGGFTYTRDFAQQDKLEFIGALELYKSMLVSELQFYEEGG